VECLAVAAIGLTAQVGTYIVDGESIISWNEPASGDALTEILAAFPVGKFIAEIGMPHPPLASYPLPRLLHIKRRWPDFRFVCQPKDFLCAKLTGKYITDPYSWRGLAHTGKGCYSDFFLNYLGLGRENLPAMADVLAPAGYITATAAAATGLPQGIPVYVGCNDFFAGLLGMGVWQAGELFDATGTSEHFGLLTERLIPDTKMVSGPYFQHFVHYGVTASSGAALEFGRRLFGNPDLEIDGALKRQPPVFLPYLNGERAPVWDPEAKGLFLGIGKDCSSADLAYAIREGVVFSLRHICDHLGLQLGEKSPRRLITAGGAARDPVLNAIKAEVFGLPVQTLVENDTSALGAAMIAAISQGWHPTLPEAQKAFITAGETVVPTGRFAEKLKQRYQIYRSLYPALKESFKMWGSVSE